MSLSLQNADTTSSLDLHFSLTREESGLDDNWDLWKGSLTQNLEVSGLGAVDDWSLTRFLFLVVGIGFWGDQAPQLFYVDARAYVGVLAEAEMTHTNFSDV